MKQYLKISLLSAVIVNLSACSWLDTKEIENQGNAPVVDTSPQATMPVAYATRKSASMQANQAGITHIRRHGKSFDIDVMLDTTDDNVYFEMALPNYAKNPDSEYDMPEELKDEMAKKDKKKDDKEKAMDDEDREPTAEEIAQSSRHILYAQTYFYEGAYDRAVSEVNQAIKLNKKSAVAYALKGSIHYKLNEINKAKVAWKTALDIDPGIDNVRYMLEKLEQ